MKLLRTPDDRFADLPDWPFLTAFSDGDPITAGGERAFLRSVPGARSVTIAGAGHFLQEDAGPRLAAVIAAFIEGQDIEETI